MQFDTDLVALRQQSAPFYLRWQFWWTAVPILLTLVLAAVAVVLRVTSPNAVGLPCCPHSEKDHSSSGQLLVAANPSGQIWTPSIVPSPKDTWSSLPMPLDSFCCQSSRQCFLGAVS